MVHKIEQLLERKDIKEKVTESLKRTKETNKEYGFNFCSYVGDISVTEVEEGIESTLNIKDACLKDGKVIGAFHTHTILTKDRDIIPSPRDIIKSMEEDVEFFCIGGNKENIAIVRCFNKDDLLLEMNAILEATKKPITKENVERSSRHLVGRMLSEKDYLNRHSYIRLYDIGGK